MSRRKLLVIDGEVDLLAVLVREARERGYEASGTMDARAALGRVRSLVPDVVLLDLHMPLVDGRDLLIEITSEPMSPAVIVMSAWVDQYAHDLCRKHGAADILRKPFELDDLFRRVDAVAQLVGAR